MERPPTATIRAKMILPSTREIRLPDWCSVRDHFLQSLCLQMASWTPRLRRQTATLPVVGSAIITVCFMQYAVESLIPGKNIAEAINTSLQLDGNVGEKDLVATSPLTFSALNQTANRGSSIPPPTLKGLDRRLHFFLRLTTRISTLTECPSTWHTTFAPNRVLSTFGQNKMLNSAGFRKPTMRCGSCPPRKRFSTVSPDWWIWSKSFQVNSIGLRSNSGNTSLFVSNAKSTVNYVIVIQFEQDETNHVVQTRGQTATDNHVHDYSFWSEEILLFRTRWFECPVVSI